MPELLPLFVSLAGRRVLMVGAGPVAASKLAALRAAGANIHVVAPDIHPDIARADVRISRRPFVPDDVDGAWLVVAAATPDVNRAVAVAAEARQILVNAVDDPANATAYLGGVVRRDGVTLAISTSGEAPAIAGLLREALDAVLPEDLDAWMGVARKARANWRRDRVPMAERRPLLLRALNELYDRLATAGDATPRGEAVPLEADVPAPGTPMGHVSLVGAGPGDPRLLTRAAVARLRAADIVLYDALVDPRVVDLARRAQRFFVGKRAGHHALSQSEIHAAMVGAARRGRRVVRLKGGDPFVFGRGGEEALALLAAGVPFDLVPGVSSAVAAPALAGIPVTHRGVASGLLIVSGHDVRACAEAATGLSGRGLTLVILMGMARRAELAALLLAGGWPDHVAAAVVSGASLPEQHAWRGTLGELAAGRAPATGDGPATIVVGEVAAMNLTGARSDLRRAAIYDLQAGQGSEIKVQG